MASLKCFGHFFLDFFIIKLFYYKLNNSLFLYFTEAQPQPCQTPNMKRFAKIVNGIRPLTVFTKYFLS